MSSTVTTATVTTVVTATAGDGVTFFPLLAVLLLAAVLLTREALNDRDGGVRRLARGLDIATVPLIAAYAVISSIGVQS